MASTRRCALAVALALLAVGAGAAATGALATGQGDAAPASSGLVQADGETTQGDDATTQDGDATTQDGPTSAQDQPGATGCDYVELYDRSIDSVVSVRAGGGLGSGFVYRVDDGEAAAGAGNETTADGTAANDTAGDAAANETAADGATGNASAANASATYVVTNAHVVRGTETVEVQFGAGETRTGEVVGTDAGVDLAVVRVDDAPDDATALPVAETSPREGQPVAAIGSPFGLDQTITHGIVSGSNRSMPTRQGFTVPNVVQTDAPINPGNSGGPLVTCDGTVVGVNTAGLAAQRAEDVGFAVSGSTVEQVVPTLIEEGDYDHSYLGVRTIPFGPLLAEANNLDLDSGVYVHEVPQGSPAEGVLRGTTGADVVEGQRVPVGGDVIVAVDGLRVESGEELSSYLLGETRPGEEVELTVVRDGERQEVTVELGERPEPESTPVSPGGQPGGPGTGPGQPGASPGAP